MRAASRRCRLAGPALVALLLAAGTAGHLALAEESRVPRAATPGPEAPPGKPARRTGFETPAEAPPRPPQRPEEISQRAAEAPGADVEPPRPLEPTGYLIYLRDGGDPIVVTRYVEAEAEIRFEKYGGWVGIPRYEILRIVPDLPLAAPGWPPATASADTRPPESPLPEPGKPADGSYLLSLRNGGHLRVSGVRPEGERLRITVPDGSFTVPRTEVVGLVRVARGSDPAEAWLALVREVPVEPRAGQAQPAVPAPPPPPPAPDQPAMTTAAATGTAPPLAAPAPPVPSATLRELPAASGTGGHLGDTAPAGPRLPYAASDRPHLVRLAGGQILRVEGFWVEDGQVRFRRFGGIVGIALQEVVRLVPEEIVPGPGRVAVRFTRQLGPDRLEVRLRSGPQPVRLLGIQPVDGAAVEDNPWQALRPGLTVFLEFDRQRYDAGGDWLAYVFLPDHRMLNAELVRRGLARPAPDGRNVRYLDLLVELATGDLPDPPR